MENNKDKKYVDWEKLSGIHPNEWMDMLFQQRRILLDELNSLNKEGILPDERFKKVIKECTNLIPFDRLHSNL